MSNYRPVVYLVLVVIGVMLLLFFINQTAQVVALASTIHPVLGQGTLYGLLVLYVSFLVVPLLWMIRLPRPLPLPVDEDDPAYGEYLRLLGKRLERNPRLRDISVDTTDAESIHKALAHLDGQADKHIKTTAKRIFVATAISQYGRLDGLIVLITQMQMIWEIMRIYHQRPSFREVITLYLNVGGTAFMATEMGDMNIVDEHVEAVFAPILGSSILPGTVLAVVGNSLVQGAANAFMTLRIAVIAREYYSSTHKKKRRDIRRSAMAQAALMLGAVVSESSGAIIASIWRAAGRTGTKTARAGYSLAARGVKGVMRVPLPSSGWQVLLSKVFKRKN